METAVQTSPLRSTKEPRAFLDHGLPAGGLLLEDLEIEILGGVFPNISADVNIHRDSDGLAYGVVSMVMVEGYWHTIRRCTKANIGLFWGAGMYDDAAKRDIAARIAREIEQNPDHALDEIAHERLGNY